MKYQHEEKIVRPSFTIGFYNETLLNTKPIFSVKLPVITNKHYPELQIFRQKIEHERNGVFHSPYLVEKRKLFKYKAAFFGFFCLFLSLAIILTMQKFRVPFYLHSGLFLWAKQLIILLCFFLSGTSLSMLLFLRAEKEAAAHIFRKAKQRLRSCFDKKIAEAGLRRFIPFGISYRKLEAFRYIHRETKAKIQDKYEETLALIDKILRSRNLDRESQEQLLNQALLEFEDKIHFHLQTFRNTDISLLASAL